MSLVYISSTFQDLKTERRAAYQAVRRLRHDAIAMEDYVAADERPLDRCLADVRRCDVYVGLLGWRYGYVPPGRNRSITELELREALKAKKPCLVFIQDDSAKPRVSDRADRRRIENLRATLGKRFLVSFFTTPDDLAAKVTAAVANVGNELTEAIGRLNIPLSRVIAEVRRLGEMPRLAPAEIVEEVDNLQRDATNWVADGRFWRTAQLRLDEARRLVASGSKEIRRHPGLLTSLGYVEKTAAQIAEGRGDAKGAKKAYQSAERYFRAALKLDPTDAGALNGQANIYSARGAFEKAAKLGRVVTGYRPDYAAAYWDLAIALRGLLKAKPSRALVEELADVCETLVELIPREPGGFTSGEFATAQADARRFRRLASQLARARRSVGARSTPRRRRVRRNRPR